MALVQYQDVASELGHQLHVVGDEDDGVALAVEVSHLFHQGAGTAPIQARRRLVQHQNLGTHGPDRRQGDLPPQAVSEDGGWSIGLVFKPKESQSFSRTVRHLPLRETQIARAKSDLLPNRGSEDLMVGVLEEVTDFPRQLPHTLTGRVLTQDEDSATGGTQQAVEVLDQGGLAGTVLADDGQEVTGLDT